MLSLDNKLTATGIFIWLICALFFTYEFFLRTVLGTFQHPIMYDLSLSPFSFAILSTTSFLFTYGLMQIPVGLIVNRYGLKKTLSFSVALCALTAVWFSFTYQVKTAIIIRMLMGLGASFGFVCLLVAVYDWMPRKHYGLFVGLSQFIGTMGPMLAAGPLNSLATKGNTDWRSVLLIFGLIGLVLLMLVFFFVRNNENSTNTFRIIKKPESAKNTLSQILKQPQIWLIASYSSLVYFALEYLSENEGKAFLELNGFSSNFSSYMITVGWIGYAIGCPLLGFLSDVLKRRKSIMVLSAFISLVSIIFVVYFPTSKLSVTTAFFFLGLGASGQSVGFAIMAEQCNKAYLAVGLGFNNAMITLLSSINAPLIGWLLDHHASSASVSLKDYYFAFSFMVALIALSFIVSIFFIKETFCRPTKGFTVIN